MSGDPLSTEKAVFLFTAVLDPEGERAALIVGVFQAFVATWAWNGDEGTFATLHEAIADSRCCTWEFISRDEPSK